MLHPVYFCEPNDNLLEEKIKTLQCTNYFILTDENTAKLCLPLLPASDRDNAEKVFIHKAGEQAKSLTVFEKLCKALLKADTDRSSLLICLGGGVICDLGGFVASVFKRGINFFYLPTSLMAMTDAAIGGKTGINLGHFKNQIGSFSMPEAVFVYPEFLNTLPKAEFYSGYAEIIKHALIKDVALWQAINNYGPDDFCQKPDLQIIKKSVNIKSDICERDFKEAGERKLLNFGHNFGHVFESLLLKSKKAEVFHGMSVAEGILVESLLSHYHCGLPKEQLDEITTFIRKHYQPIPQIMKIEEEAMIAMMTADKKNTAKGINFSLIQEIGTSSKDQYPEIKLIKEVFKEYKSRYA